MISLNDVREAQKHESYRSHGAAVDGGYSVTLISKDWVTGCDDAMTFVDSQSLHNFIDNLQKEGNIMNFHIAINNQKELDAYITQHEDHCIDTTYLSQNKESEECFAICGCTYASEAFRFVDEDYRLIITDSDYASEIDMQVNSEYPELAGFKLKDE